MTVLAVNLLLILGTMTVFAPSSSATGSWTTLARHCWTIQEDGNRLRACTSIKGGVVGDQFMVRARCRVKTLNFEPPYLWVENCNLYARPSFDELASRDGSKRYGVTAAIVKTSLVPCDPTIWYWGLSSFSFRYPDGSIGAYGLAVDWLNESDCAPPT